MNPASNFFLGCALGIGVAMANYAGFTDPEPGLWTMIGLFVFNAIYYGLIGKR